LYDLIVIGGGAAGFFGAIQCAEKSPHLKILILEKGLKVLQKVKVSGGGRCNVTHACFNPKELVQYYPRGQKELLGPFNQFACGDMMAWLDQQGVPTKIEEDGRTFPASNKSQTIIDCFETLTEKYGIEIKKQQSVIDLKQSNAFWQVQTNQISFQLKVF